MSLLRQKFGSALQESALMASRHGGQGAAKAVAVHVNTAGQYNHLTNNWVRRLG